MKVHKLTAGDGYTYLTRQVAAQDVTHRGRSGLGSYYSEKGEAPGVWMGAGLGGVLDFRFDGPVTEDQMRLLFGEGRHPNAREVERAARAEGKSEREIDRASMLGAPYKIYGDANEFRAHCAEAFAAKNCAAGLPRDWPVAAGERAAIRTQVAREMFGEAYGREPIDARELSGHLARVSRQATTAVAGYDLSFSPVKSVSTLWAIAPREVSEVIEGCHRDAVADTLTWIERNAAFTRRGRNGVAQVNVKGLIAAAFTHRDSRAGDPDLHTHVAVSNKVQALEGTWLALDGRAIYKNNVPASERYNTRLEALLTERLGVRFAEREATGHAGSKSSEGRHPIREIVGVDGELPWRWSKRRNQIELRRAVLSAGFQERHGRPPTTKEAGELGQQATLETRQAKHEPRSHAEQRTAWRAEAITVLGSELALRSYLRVALHPARMRGERGVRLTDRRVRTIAEEVLFGQVGPDGRRVGGVQNQRAVWQENHVRAEAERRVRAANIRRVDVDEAVDAVVQAALGPAMSLPLDTHEPPGHTVGAETPAALRRADGSSVYTVAGTRLYTSTAVIEAEQAILAAAAQRGGRRLTDAQVDVALLESVANNVHLNPGQSQLVRELATSGARVQLALAPAGTGKTTAMRVLASAWTASGGNVIGLAPSAAAAAVLREEIGAKTDTLAKLIVDLQQSAGTDPHRFDGTRTLPGPVLNVPFAERAAAKNAGARFDPTTKTWFAPGGDAQVADGARLARWRDWLTTVGPNTLVVIDEAGMAATPDLDKAIAFVLARGGSVRLVGDDQQLAAIGAGGVLRDIAGRHGAVTLSQVMRFTHPAGHPHAGTPNHAEGAASLALRNGDPATLGYYLDQQRVHVGDLTTCADAAYDAWRADRAAGRDAIMLAPTRDLVAQLNSRARADQLAVATAAIDTPTEAGSEATVQLADGLTCSAGDTIISRQNDRTIPVGTTDWVKNGDRWTVDAVLESGALRVTHLRTKRHITLPASYVRDHVELGYACTIHAAQGVTADSCHTVATGDESRQLFYVAMTRGRSGNHVYLTTAGDGDPHAVITREALLPPTAVDVLTRILARDDAPVSATSTAQDLNDPNRTLHHAADLYFDALTTAAAVKLGPERMAAIDRAANAAVPHLTDLAAYPALRVHLALCTVAGADPADLLARAITDTSNRGQDAGHGLVDAREAAAVLDWRLGFSTGTDSIDRTGLAVGGPLPWLPTIPEPLRHDRQWGAYLQAAADDVRAQAAAIRDQASRWTPTDAPAWAGPLIDTSTDRDRELAGDVAVWRAATGVEPDDWRQTGERQLPAAEAHAQRALDQRIARVLGDPNASATTWKPVAESVDPRVTGDPYWPVLATQLTAAHRAGIDITTLTRAVAATGPLPDEQPAAALWWRLARHLSPAAITASASSVNQTLRPDWTPALTQMFGTDLADRITADPGWPGLVAAATHGATPHGATPGWNPPELLHAAHDLIRGAQPDIPDDTAPLRPGELTTALTWRISMLTDPDPVAAAAARSTATAPGNTDPAGAPANDTDAQLWPDAAPVLDDDWLASLSEPDPEPDDADAPPPDDRDEPPADLHTVHQNNATAGIVWVADGSDTDPILERRRGALYEYPASAEAPRERVVALNQAAADFYADSFPASWAASYVTDRLAVDPATVARNGDAQVSLADFGLGYAPDGWTSLVDHLRTTSEATDRELIAAGLASYAKTGRLIDRFRDRLVFPVTALDANQQPEVHGFIARRNPNHDPAPGTEADPRHGPKYLNTPETDLFHKGHELFGLAQTRALQAAGATPVHVEGPIDALAITLAGGGRYVGLAPMGTALTNVQADRLAAAANPADRAPTPGENKPRHRGIIVATDTDHAGLQAAHHAYWQLVLRGETPRRLAPTGTKDPAEMLHDHGPRALRDALDASPSLAGALLNAVIDGHAHRLDTVEGRVAAARRSAKILAALPPDQWAPHLARLAQRVGVDVDTVTSEVLDAHDKWLSHPAKFAAHQRGQRLPAPATPTPTSRWAQLAERINPRLTLDPSWPALARTIDHAAATGYDVETQLPTLANRRPLPSDHPARSLEYRLLDAHPDSSDPTHIAPTLYQTRAAESEAAARLASDKPHRTTTPPIPRSAPATQPRSPAEPIWQTPSHTRNGQTPSR
jgi:conjugative relaxase-like TrwC/TraI family protein